MFLSTLAKPAIVAMTMGKKLMKTANARRDSDPIPNQMMNSGASAILGIS
jgi:hypothetical protein